jgi:hypothetical protein
VSNSDFYPACNFLHAQQLGCYTACNFHDKVKPFINNADDVLDNVTEEFKLVPTLLRPDVGVLEWELTKRVNTNPIQYVGVECTPLLYTIFFADAGEDVHRWIFLGQVRTR